MKDEVMQTILDMKEKQGMTFPQVIEEFKVLEAAGKIHNLGISGMSQKSLANKLRRFKEDLEKKTVS